jgi:glucose-1-phosphate cytidylyltransferase
VKVVILAGGYGSRLSELTKIVPKPMVKITGKPIIQRIIDYYISYGHYEFYIALGYKGEVLKKYFSKKKFSKKIKINLIKTGKKTMTGGRLKRLSPYLKETFLMTYGDGLSNVNLDKLLSFHKKNKKTVTLTAVRPPARFGAIKIRGYYVNCFKEKNNLDEGWINGGFFVIEPRFLKYLTNDNTYLEREPFEKLTRNRELLAYKHKGFWQCMDTLRDKEILVKKLKKINFLRKIKKKF